MGDKSRKINVLVITQDEPFFIPKMVSVLLDNQNKFYNIYGITVLKPHRKNKSYLHWFNERAKVYNLIELILSGFLFLYTKFHSLFFKSSIYSVRNVSKSNNIQLIETDDINSEDFFRKLEREHIDVIISISCPQIFKKSLLNSVDYCINAHGTLLPRHRGVFGSWWVLFSEDEKAGSTIHTMEEKLDAGEILWQKEFPVEDSDTQYSIAYKTKKDMAFGLVETLINIFEKDLKIIKPKFSSSYHKAPNKKESKFFHKKGLKVISFKDLKLVLSQQF